MIVDGERLVELRGVRQWVRVAGASHATVPLVLVHGGPGGNHFVFERTAGPLLAARRTVVYHEQRGCGRSEAPEDEGAYTVEELVADLDALRAHLGVERMDLLGYSFGGGLVLAYAARHPARVRRVIAQAPVLDVRDERVARAQLAGFAAVSRGAVRAEIERVLASHETPAEQLQRVWAAVDVGTVDAFLFEGPAHAARNRAWWLESGLVNTGLMHAVVRRAPILAWSALAEVTAPTLVLIGERDRNVPPSYAREVASALPRGEFALVPGAAHFPDIEAPHAYAERVRTFLRPDNEPR